MKRVVNGTISVCVQLHGGIQHKHLRPVRQHLENRVVRQVPLLLRDHELVVPREAISENGHLPQTLSPVAPYNAIVEAETTVRHIKKGVHVDMALPQVIYAQDFGIVMKQDFGIGLRLIKYKQNHSINGRIKHFDGLLDIQQRVESKHAGVLVLGNVGLMNTANTIAHDGVDFRSLAGEESQMHKPISETPESSGRNGSPPFHGKTGQYPGRPRPRWTASSPAAFLEAMLYSMTKRLAGRYSAQNTAVDS